MDHLRPFLGPYTRARAITTDRVLAYVRHRQEQGAANATVNRELSALKRMFRLGERVGKVAHRPYIAMLKEAAPRQGFLAPDEFESLLSHLPDSLKAVFATAYITGWRLRSEVLTRKRSHLDLGAGWLRIDAGEDKNGAGRMFPLAPALHAVLEPHVEATKGTASPWLFHHRGGKPIKSFRRARQTACLKAGLATLVSERPRVIKTLRIPHDFRRTAVRNLERSGVPRSLAMAMVGHKTENVYRRYAIADEFTLREGAVKLQALHDLQGASAWTGGASGVVVPRQPAVVASHSIREQAESALSAERSG